MRIQIKLFISEFFYLACLEKLKKMTLSVFEIIQGKQSDNTTRDN